MTDTPNPHCENCGQTIGKLEQPHTWGSANVCWDCFSTLSEQRKAQAAKESPAPEVPDYSMLKFVADCLWYLGWAALIVGIPVGLFCSLISLLSSNRSYLGFWFAVLINMLLWGLSATATAQFLYCIRDMARNSWKIASK